MDMMEQRFKQAYTKLSTITSGGIALEYIIFLFLLFSHTFIPSIYLLQDAMVRVISAIGRFIPMYIATYLLPSIINIMGFIQSLVTSRRLSLSIAIHRQ